MKITAYDIIKAFNNKEEWEKITTSEKASNFFLLNRTMSIKFPIHAHSFNLNKIDAPKVINWWQAYISGRGEAIGFIFTSTGKKAKVAAKKPISPEVLKFLCEKYEISMREIKDLMEFYPLEFQKYCESVKEMIS